jgi:DNA (cytosine-5)-methyltransferase 1
MNHISLFNGISTTLYAAELNGWTNIAASENCAWCNKHLHQWFPNVIALGDITTADFTRFGALDNTVLSGGFPCQNISAIGRGEGIRGAKSGLWSHYRRAIQDIRPRYAIIENSSRLNTKGIEVVLHDLAAIGYDAEWCTLSAAQFGADHTRSRMWILAYPNGSRRQNILHIVERIGTLHAQAYEAPKRAGIESVFDLTEWIEQSHDEPALLGDNHGVAGLVDRCRAIGNGQVPGVAAMAWRILSMHNTELNGASQESEHHEQT